MRLSRGKNKAIDNTYHRGLVSIAMAVKKNRAAVALARLRMQKLTQEQRTEAARKGGRARMKKLTKAERRALGRLGGRPRKEPAA